MIKVHRCCPYRNRMRCNILQIYGLWNYISSEHNILQYIKEPMCIFVNILKCCSILISYFNLFSNIFHFHKEKNCNYSWVSIVSVHPCTYVCACVFISHSLKNAILGSRSLHSSDDLISKKISPFELQSFNHSGHPLHTCCFHCGVSVRLGMAGSRWVWLKHVGPIRRRMGSVASLKSDLGFLAFHKGCRPTQK